MKKRMLVFESPNECDQLEIHINETGINTLIENLRRLLNGETHIHLKTPSWGGNELTEEAQSKEHHVINHVKIVCWHD